MDAKDRGWPALLGWLVRGLDATPRQAITPARIGLWLRDVDP
jgi:hypothetical protein